jgi:hypothetical protein
MATPCHTPIQATPPTIRTIYQPHHLCLHPITIVNFVIIFGPLLSKPYGLFGFSLRMTATFHLTTSGFMGIWQSVAMDSLRFHLGSPCPTLLRPAGGPPMKRPHGCFRGDPPIRWAACGHLLPLWIPLAIRLCLDLIVPKSAC